MRFVLSTPVKLHVSQIGARAVVDLAEPNFSGAMPDLVAPPSPRPSRWTSPPCPRSSCAPAAYEKFTRLVFDWPKDVSYQVFPGAGKMTIKFASPGARRCLGPGALRAALGEERRLAH